jgi:diguanylate cyclase (GGDEF)-like protein
MAENQPMPRLISGAIRSALIRYVVALVILAALTGFSFLVVRSLISGMRQSEVLVAEAADLRSAIHKTMLELDSAAAGSEPSAAIAARAEAEVLRTGMDRLLILLTGAGVDDAVWAIVRRPENGLERTVRVLIEQGHSAGSVSSGTAGLHASREHGREASSSIEATKMSHDGALHGPVETGMANKEHVGHSTSMSAARQHGGHSAAMIAVDELIGEMREEARAEQSRTGLIHDLLGVGIFLILLIEAAIVFRPLLRTAETETRRAEKATSELEYLAAHDALTGLLNRGQIDRVLNVAVREAASFNQHLGLILLDLDEFKPINDSLGHAAGDAILISVAEKIHAALRPRDIAGRLGGDEFIVVLPDVSQEDEVKAVADRILESLSVPVVFEGHELIAKASIGYAVFPIAGSDVSALMSAADLAMYSAKRNGRGKVSEFSEPMRAEAERARAVERRLKEAFAERQFEVFYQTIQSTRTGRISAVEALLRWRHPERGLLEPAEFLEDIRRTGRIGLVNKFVASEAIKQFAIWRAAGLSAGSIHVNIGEDFLRDPGAVLIVEELLRTYSVSPSEFALEVTEDAKLDDQQVAATLDAFHARGIRLAVDDWGAGRVSLRELRHPSIKIVKIDRSVVHAAFSSEDGPGVMVAMSELCRSLGKTAIVEGIETEEMATLIMAAGFDLVQGYYFNNPQSPAQMSAYLASKRETRAAAMTAT